jgi:hypothetical protein
MAITIFVKLGVTRPAPLKSAVVARHLIVVFKLFYLLLAARAILDLPCLVAFCKLMLGVCALTKPGVSHKTAWKANCRLTILAVYSVLVSLSLIEVLAAVEFWAPSRIWVALDTKIFAKLVKLMMSSVANKTIQIFVFEAMITAVHHTTEISDFSIFNR